MDYDDGPLLQDRATLPVPGPDGDVEVPNGDEEAQAMDHLSMNYRSFINDNINDIKIFVLNTNIYVHIYIWTL